MGVAEERGTLMAIQHVGMLPAMLVAMLLRRDEYSGRPSRRGRDLIADPHAAGRGDLAPDAEGHVVACRAGRRAP